MTMTIELMGGPGDGLLLAVPAQARLWVIPAPQMTPAQLIALENGGPYSASVIPVIEHIYVWSSRFGRRTSARLFHYTGPRRSHR